MARLNRNTTKGRIPTTGEAFPNGVLLDLIRDEQSNELGLLAWDKSKTRIGGQLEYGGRTYVPVEVDPTVLSALQLPTHSSSCGAPTCELFGDIYTELARYTDLPDPILSQITSFIFATWLADRLPRVPLLWIVAPEWADGDVLLQLLALFCRRSLLLAGDCVAGLWTLPMNLQPTLLLDCLELTVSIQKFLHASSSKSHYFARKGQTLNFCCAKAVCAQDSLRDRVLADFALQINLPPNRKQRPALTPEESQRIAMRFQADLLWYRLKNYHRICTSDIDVSGLTAPKQRLASSLAACILDDKELQSEIILLLGEQDRENKVERCSGLEVPILEALLSCCHDGKRSTLRVAELAEITNAMLTRRGEHLQVSPETVGWKLRSLRLRTEPVGSGGKGLWLLADVRRRIHTLATEYQVSLNTEGALGCIYCSNSMGEGQLAGSEGVKKAEALSKA